MSATGDRLLSDIHARTIGLERNQSKLTTAINSLNKTLRNQTPGGKRLSGSTRDIDRQLPRDVNTGHVARIAKNELKEFLSTITKKKALGIGAGLGFLAMFGDLFDPNKMLKDIGKQMSDRAKGWKNEITRAMNEYMDASLDALLGRDTPPDAPHADERRQIDRVVDAARDAEQALRNRVQEEARDRGIPTTPGEAYDFFRSDRFVPWLQDRMVDLQERIDNQPTPTPVAPTTTPSPRSTPVVRPNIPGIENVNGREQLTPQLEIDHSITNSSELRRTLRRRAGAEGAAEQQTQREADSAGMTYEDYTHSTRGTRSSTGANATGPLASGNIDSNEVTDKVAQQVLQKTVGELGKNIAVSETAVGIAANLIRNKDVMGQAMSPLARAVGVTAATLVKYANPIGYAISAGQGIYAGHGIHKANAQMRKEAASIKEQENITNKWINNKRATAARLYASDPKKLKMYNKYLNAVKTRHSIGGTFEDVAGAGLFGMGEWLVGKDGLSRERTKEDELRLAAANSYIDRNNPKIMAMEDEIKQFRAEQFILRQREKDSTLSKNKFTEGTEKGISLTNTTYNYLHTPEKDPADLFTPFKAKINLHE